MFGMSSIEFWEEEPQLYWAYRFSFIKNKEIENKAKIEEMRLNCWLQGKINNIAFGVALNNAFTKKKMEYPTYEQMFKSSDVEDTKAYREISKEMEGVEDKNEMREIEFNYWARLDRKGD